MGKSTISMAIFNSKLLVYQKVPPYEWGYHASHDEDMEDFTSPEVASLKMVREFRIPKLNGFPNVSMVHPKSSQIRSSFGVLGGSLNGRAGIARCQAGHSGGLGRGSLEIASLIGCEMGVLLGCLGPGS